LSWVRRRNQGEGGRKRGAMLALGEDELVCEILVHRALKPLSGQKRRPAGVVSKTVLHGGVARKGSRRVNLLKTPKKRTE